MFKGCLGGISPKWCRCGKYESKNIRVNSKIFNRNLSFFKVLLSNCFPEKEWKMFSCHWDRYFNRLGAQSMAIRVKQ